jgi:salicylate 5-hydroxylase large subunit
MAVIPKVSRGNTAEKIMIRTERPETSSLAYTWPEEGVSRIPYWVYMDPEVYEREQRRIFQGPTWNYAGLEAEIPNPGDFKSTFVGDCPVVIVRSKDGALRGFVNRCAHRGSAVCRSRYGNAKDFTCIYHQWRYDLAGKLVAVPFRRGVPEGDGRVGGMPDDFQLNEHNLQSLKVESVNGVVFVSFDLAMVPVRAYLGPLMTSYFERVFDGRPLRLLGRMSQRVRSNWKLMMENIKDPYHASLLHVFLVSFGLFRADQKSKVEMDESGGHAVLVSRKGEQKHSGGTAEIANLKADYVLHDPSLLDRRKEFPDENTVVMQTIFPALIVQQQTNTLALRQIVTRGPDQFDLIWDFFGYGDDDEQMAGYRLKQANLMGPSGLVSIDDTEALEVCQKSFVESADRSAFVELGGHGWENVNHMVTESAIRAMYRCYRDFMQI